MAQVFMRWPVCRIFQSSAFGNLSRKELSRNDLDKGSYILTLGIHGCLVLSDPLGYQPLYILQSDNCVTTPNPISFFTLSVSKVSSEISDFSLFLCKLSLQLLHLFLEAWGTGNQD